MASFLYRFLISLTGLAPMSFAFLCPSSNKDNIWDVGSSFMYALLICGIACFILHLLIKQIKKGCSAKCFDHREITTISQDRNGLMAYFMSYVMPLFLGNSNEISFLIFCVIALVLATLFSNSLLSNPLFNVLGYRFYILGMKSGISMLLISKSPPQKLKNTGFKASIYESDTLIEDTSK